MGAWNGGYRTRADRIVNVFRFPRTITRGLIRRCIRSGRDYDGVPYRVDLAKVFNFQRKQSSAIEIQSPVQHYRLSYLNDNCANIHIVLTKTNGTDHVS